MPDANKVPRPVHVITQMLPFEVLRQLNELARRFQRDEIFRAYVQQHVWLIFPVCIFLAFMVLAVCIGAMVGASYLLEPTTRWARLTILGLGFLFWIVSTVFVIYRYFLSLEREALRLHELDS